MTLPVVLSYGMGIDSTAILLRWLSDPSSRDFDLSNLVVLTAMTGDEFADTEQFVSAHVLPRLRHEGVRYVQIARNGAAQADGISVLDDSRRPTTLHLRTPYRLSTELTEAGTIPQVATGRRLCSLHFKGWPLDTWLAGEFGSKPFRHVMGFNAGEMRRVLRDASYSTEQRRSEYPLVEWGWDREHCASYITAMTGAIWAKSCCEYCPFAQERHLDRYMADPDAAVRAMLIEFRSLALNPRSTLFAKESVIELVRRSGNEVAVKRFDHELSICEWSVYEVRRGFSAKTHDPSKKGPAFRSIRVLATGTYPTCRRALGEVAERENRPVILDNHGIERLALRTLRATYPATEHFYVIAPAGTHAKERPGFQARWRKAISAEEGPTHWLVDAMRRSRLNDKLRKETSVG